MSQDAIFSLLQDIRETQLHQAELQGKMSSDIEALAGPHGRVTNLEHAQTRNFWTATLVAPILALAHGVARKYGVNI
jgi:hypothetical protein